MRRSAYPWGMDVIPIRPERRAQLEDYAQRQGQEPAAALDEVLADALEWERQDYHEAVEGIRQGYTEFKAGQARAVEESFAELREKHGLPR